MRYVKVAAGLWFVVVMAGCATPYQKSGLLGGYDDFRITQDTFEVSFKGNGYTSRSKVSRYVLRRAAEVTLLHEFTHFAPVRELDHSTVTMVHSSSGHGYAQAQGTSTGAQTWGHGYSTGASAPVVKPATTLRIRCFKEPPPDIDGLICAHDYLAYNYPDALAELDAQLHPTTKPTAKF